MVQHRLARLESLLKQGMADILEREIKDLTPGLVTITRVILSRDLRHAKFYLSIYGSEEAQDRAMVVLTNKAKRVRGLISRRVKMRYTPEIAFIHDKSMEEASHILKLMKDIERESAERDRRRSKKI